MKSWGFMSIMKEYKNKVLSGEQSIAAEVLLHLPIQGPKEVW